MIKKVFLLYLLSCTTFVLAQEKNYTSNELSIPTEFETIHGTLLTPETVTKSALVIIIPGSGPTDRNGNNVAMKNNSLKFLAEALAGKEIASYRFDKSILSYGKDDKAKIDSLTFEVFISEAKSVVAYFKDAANFSKIIIAGHSQGSLVGMVVAQNNADGFISLAGAGRSIDVLLIEQIEKQAPFLKEETERVLAELKKGNTVDDFNQMLVSLFNKQVQPFLISWIKYDPQEELKKLKIPVLIVNGSKDIQTSTTDAELLHKATENSQLELIENMNHLFKEIKGDINENMLSYTNPELSVMVELINVISTFVNEIK